MRGDRYRDPSRYEARPYVVLPLTREIEICGLLLAWYGSSTMIIICFKSLTSRPELEFGYGCGITLYTNLLTFIVTSVVTAVVRTFFYTGERAPPRVGLLDPRAAPIGALAGVELALSNVALVQLSMTFRTMLHSCAPCLMLTFGVLFGVERASSKAVLAVLLLTAGGVLSGLAEGADFRTRGIGIQFLASVISVVRWVWVQKFFQQPAEGHSAKHPLKVLDLARVMSLYVAIVAAVLTCVVEPAALGPVGRVFGADPQAAGALGRHFPVIAAFVGLATCGVFVLNLAEMRLTALTSALTLSVAAALHNIPILVAGLYTFEERLNLVHMCSFVLIMAGTGLYIAIRSEQAPAPKAEKPLLLQVCDDGDFPELAPFLAA